MDMHGVYICVNACVELVHTACMSHIIISPILIVGKVYKNCLTDVRLYIFQCVREGDMKIIPQVHEKTWYNWMENCRFVLSSILYGRKLVNRF